MQWHVYSEEFYFLKYLIPKYQFNQNDTLNQRDAKKIMHLGWYHISDILQVVRKKIPLTDSQILKIPKLDGEHTKAFKIHSFRQIQFWCFSCYWRSKGFKMFILTNVEINFDRSKDW